MHCYEIEHNVMRSSECIYEMVQLIGTDTCRWSEHLYLGKCKGKGKVNIEVNQMAHEIMAHNGAYNNGPSGYQAHTNGIFFIFLNTLSTVFQLKST